MSKVDTWVLAVDTSGGISVGLARDGVQVDSAIQTDTRKHVEELTLMVSQMLASHELTAGDLSMIGVGIGPGPFTGLRIGIVTARILGMAVGVPVRGFSSLDALALTVRASIPQAEEIAITLDARRKELYWASYDGAGARLYGPNVSAPADIPQLPVAGSAAVLYPEAFAGRIIQDSPTRMDPVLVAARLSELPDTGLEPAYLRKPDAEVPRTRKSALASAKRLRIPYPQENR